MPPRLLRALLAVLLTLTASSCTGWKDLARPPYVKMKGKTLEVTHEAALGRPQDFTGVEKAPDPSYRYRLWLSVGDFHLTRGTRLRVTGLRGLPPQKAPWPRVPHAEVLATVLTGPHAGQDVTIYWGGTPETAPAFVKVLE